MSSFCIDSRYTVLVLCHCRPRLIKLSCRSKLLVIKVRDRNVCFTYCLFIFAVCFSLIWLYGIVLCVRDYEKIWSAPGDALSEEVEKKNLGSVWLIWVHLVDDMTAKPMSVCGYMELLAHPKDRWQAVVFFFVVCVCGFVCKQHYWKMVTKLSVLTDCSSGIMPLVKFVRCWHLAVGVGWGSLYRHHSFMLNWYLEVSV